VFTGALAAGGFTFWGLAGPTGAGVDGGVDGGADCGAAALSCGAAASVLAATGAIAAGAAAAAASAPAGVGVFAWPGVGVTGVVDSGEGADELCE